MMGWGFATAIAIAHPTIRNFPKVLPYNWEVCCMQYKQVAYCSTNGRCTVGFPFLQGLEARTAQRYKWGPYCCANWRCTAVLSPRPVSGKKKAHKLRKILGTPAGCPRDTGGTNRCLPAGVPKITTRYEYWQVLPPRSVK